MTWWQWALVVYAVGVPISGVLYLWMFYGSGGYVTNWLVVLINMFLWPIMLPIIFGMFLQSVS